MAPSISCCIFLQQFLCLKPKKLAKVEQSKGTLLVIYLFHSKIQLYLFFLNFMLTFKDTNNANNLIREFELTTLHITWVRINILKEQEK